MKASNGILTRFAPRFEENFRGLMLVGIVRHGVLRSGASEVGADALYWGLATVANSLTRDRGQRRAILRGVAWVRKQSFRRVSWVYSRGFRISRAMMSSGRSAPLEMLKSTGSLAAGVLYGECLILLCSVTSDV